MNATAFRYGFRIVGGCSETRRLVDAAAAFSGYCQCDAKADVTSEAYLSAFQFDSAMQSRADRWGRLDVRDFSGPTYSTFVWFDIDRDGNLELARHEAARLASVIAERYRIDGDELLIFFSGSKGFHVGLSATLTAATPGPTFHVAARSFAESLAAIAKVEIDTGVYDRVRAFRAPNSRHAKTGLHKRLLTFDELTALSIERIAKLAREPFGFDLAELPSATAFVNQQAADDWRQAEANANNRQIAKAEYDGKPARLTRSTRAFLAEGAATGDRHRLLFSAAANLAELGCPLGAVLELLTEPGLDSGLSPSDVRRQIECGWNHGRKAVAGGQQQAEGFDVESPSEPSPRPVAAKPKPVQVVPPPGVQLHFVDTKGRLCDGVGAVKWTWHGAKQWYSMESFAMKSQQADTDRLIEQALLANGENLTA